MFFFIKNVDIRHDFIAAILPPLTHISKLQHFEGLKEAIVYCSRDATPDISSHFKRSTLFTIGLGKDITPIYKKQDHPFMKEYKALCEKPALELKILTNCWHKITTFDLQLQALDPKRLLVTPKNV